MKFLWLFGCVMVQMMGIAFAQQEQLAALQQQFSQLADILEKAPKPKIQKAVVTQEPTISEVPAVPAKLAKEDYVKYLDTKIAELERSVTPGQMIEELMLLKGIREKIKSGESIQKAVAEEIPEAPAIIPEAPGIPGEVPVAPPVPTLEKSTKQPTTQKKTEVKKTPSPRDDVMKAIREGAFTLKKVGSTSQAVAQKAEASQKDALMQAIRGGVKLKRAKSVLPVVKPEETSDLAKALAERRRQITGSEKKESGKQENEESTTWETE